MFEINAGSQIRVSTRVFDTGVDVMFDVRSLVGQREPTSFLVGEVVSHVDTMIARLDVPGPSITAPRTKLSMYAHYRGYDYNNTPQPQVRVAPFPQDPNNQLLMAKLLELYLEERVVIDCQEIRIGSGIGEMVFVSPQALRAYLEQVARNRTPALAATLLNGAGRLGLSAVLNGGNLTPMAVVSQLVDSLGKPKQATKN